MNNPQFEKLLGHEMTRKEFLAFSAFAEVDMKSPGVSGSWLAFWMIASSYNWPSEVDIYKNVGALTET